MWQEQKQEQEQIIRIVVIFSKLPTSISINPSAKALPFIVQKKGLEGEKPPAKPIGSSNHAFVETPSLSTSMTNKKNNFFPPFMS
jgi:hypothetical protein